MHTDRLIIPELDLPVEEPSIPFVELELELDELPSMEELLRTSPMTRSPPPTINQTLFTERICIRVDRWVLGELKRRAAERGVRYQTFINLLLAQHAAS